LDTFIKLCRWLGVSPESFINEQLSKDTTSQEASTSEKVEILLRAERTLQPDTINAIIKMVNLAIKASRKGSAESTNK